MHSRSNAKKLAASAAVLAAVGAFVSFGAFSVFSDSVSNNSNLNSAKIDISGTGPTLLIDVSNLIPGDVITRCVAVTNASTVAADVALTKVTSANTTLLAAMKASVEEGTVLGGQTANDACNGFVSAGTPSFVMGSTSDLNLTTFVGGVAPTALTTQNYTGWAVDATKYFKIKLALPTSATETVQNLANTLEFKFTATSPAGSTR